jgi:MerR family redox-sensitive transcriptional activator SoxR
MAHLTISEVARQVGLRPSAIRYYEQLKILPPARRVSGQRRYDLSAVHQLAILRRAQEVGFTLDEIRHLFFGFRKSTPLSARWRSIAERKQTELDTQMKRIQSMKEVLQRLQTNCQCETVQQCGAGILHNGFSEKILRTSGRSPAY